MKLHLGCGTRRLEGWLNVDARPDVGADLCADVSALTAFEDGMAEVIYACHVLEHIPRAQVLDVLREWRRVLKPGGILRVSVPDFEAICRLYQDRHVPLWRLAGMLHGRQDHVYNAHFAVYDWHYLCWHLEQAGFHTCRLWHPEMVLPEEFDDYSRAETDGKPISLNVEATRGA